MIDRNLVWNIFGVKMEKAYVLINCELGKENLVLSELRGLKAMKEAHGTFGAYDIIDELIAENPESLRQEITWKIRKIQSIRETLTLTALRSKN